MGARAAAPIFGAFMQQALAIHPPSARSFHLPPGARIVTVDPVSGEPSKGGTAEVMRQIP
jgi:membrane carboxypeptidase/penicillin-binding protein